MENNTVRSAVLEAFEVSLSAQIKAIRSLRSSAPSSGSTIPNSGEVSHKKGRSQLDMAQNILLKARKPLHVTEIIQRIASQFDVTVDRESLVSAISKRVVRGDRFVRTDKNTFALADNDNKKPANS